MPHYLIKEVLADFLGFPEKYGKSLGIAAIFLGDDRLMGNIHQTAGQITGG